MHKVNLKTLKSIARENVIGAKHRIPKDIGVNDKIVLFAKIDGYYQFFAYTQVNEIIFTNEYSYNHYFSKKKIKLKGIKFFAKPIPYSNLKKDLEFIKPVKNFKSYFITEYRQMTENSLKSILKNAQISKQYPPYLDKIVINEEEFILKTIKVIYNILKKTEIRKQIEIKKFLQILKSVLDQYDIYKSTEELEEFYGKKAWTLGLKHNPSRDNDKYVLLYTPSGNKKNFSYISLK